MQILELFSGTGILSQVARERGHETLTVDSDPATKPDILADVRDLSANDIITWDLGDFWPDFIWASPPCNKFSIARVYDNWQYLEDGTLVPKNEETVEAIWTVLHTIRLIENLDPVLWILENPVGMLGKQPFMLKYERVRIHQCQYGCSSMKPTYLWGNQVQSFDWRPNCKPGSDCHAPSPRGSWSRYSVSGKHSKGLARATLPRALCEEVIQQVEDWK